MHKEAQIIAVCGLKCHECDILEATNKPKMAQEIVDWFKKERNEDVKWEEMRCTGCKGDRTKHWSPDCWILQCCVDKKGLELCCECEEFPCNKLERWSKGSKRYEEALNRLKGMKTTILEETKITETIKGLPRSSFTILDFMQTFKKLFPGEWKRLEARFGLFGEKRRYTVSTYLANRLYAYSQRPSSLLKPFQKYRKGGEGGYRRATKEEGKTFGSPWIAIYKKARTQSELDQKKM